MNNDTIIVRQVRESDCEQVISLEKNVWGKIGVISMSEELFHSWLNTHGEGFLVAVGNNTILGYTYNEIVEFDEYTVHTPAWQKLTREYYLRSHHNPTGNALFGISLATDPPNTGTGKYLLKAVRDLIENKKLEYWVTLARMPGLSEFINCIQNKCIGLEDLEILARIYAVKNIHLIGGKVHPDLEAIPIPQNIPQITQPDSVLCRFAKLLDMTLYAVVPSAFDDPESANLTSSLVKKMREL